MAGIGMSDRGIYQHLGISHETFYKKLKSHPELLETLKRSRTRAESEVVCALHEKAKEGSLGHIVFWLKNRSSEDWKDKLVNENTNNNFDLSKDDLKHLSTDEVKTLRVVSEKLNKIG